MDRGKEDFKVLGVPNSDPLFAEVKTLEDVPQHFLKEVAHFFSTYKQLEGVAVEALGWTGVGEAFAEVRASVARYVEQVAAEK
jgi:inorganic pyrophosphatase